MNDTAATSCKCTEFAAAFLERPDNRAVCEAALNSPVGRFVLCRSFRPRGPSQRERQRDQAIEFGERKF